ncbi:hypothetical protein V22_17330 [Calycomorphotria hydatis]|uniref:Carboxypeptidase regulatory-like domain-containing protein n=1 Tax=Calycomorphotria hydatis TaxID=2528027 RepID=A0A517T7Z8_9PLAN|nr:hypothetical protein V22_17330 [Calycomorphotria hydatis]
MLSIFITGCWSSEDQWTKNRPPVYKTSGVVLMDGEPLTEAIVVFKPENGENWGTGLTDAGGNFRLTTFEDFDGVIADNFTVTIEKSEWVPVQAQTVDPTGGLDPEPGGNGQVKKNLLSPKKYTDFETSGFTAVVTPDGPNQFEFLLDSSEE